MSIDLTDKQIQIIKWLVKKVGEGKLEEEFSLFWTISGGGCAGIMDIQLEEGEEQPCITLGIIDTLRAAGLLLIYRRATGTASCVLTGNAYEFVDSVSSQQEMSRTEKRALQERVSRHYANLQYLENQATIHGAGQVPLSLHNQITEEKKAIAELEERLRDL